MKEQNNNTNEALRDLSIQAYNLLLAQKMSSTEVTIMLIEKGLDEDKAGYLIADIEYRIKDKQKKSKEDLEKGGLVFAVGVAVTALTYLLSDYISFYVITWGFIFYGAFLLIRGFLNRN